MNKKTLLGALAAVGWALIHFSREAEAASAVSGDDEDLPTSDWPSVRMREIVKRDFKRVRFAELPPEIAKQATSFLSEPMGSVHIRKSDDGRRWAFVLEEHISAAKGKHKGVSVLGPR